MGVKADLKAARARMQAGEPSEALSMIQKILDSSSPELEDAQTLYAVLVTAGLAALAAEDLTAAESSFRRAAESNPDAPQAWKGLIDCLERAGAGRIEALPECLSRAAEIAEGKGNFSRARTLRVRLGTVLDGLGRQEEALEAVLHHVDNPEAMAAGAAGDGGGGSTAVVERLSLLLLAAVIETDREEAAVAARVEKRLAKDGGFSSGGGGGSAEGDTATADRKTRAFALAFEYRAKALAKDAAAEDGGSVRKRLSDAMQALLEAGQTVGGGAGDGSGGAGPMIQQQEDEGGSGRGVGGASDPSPDEATQSDVWKPLVGRFCRAYLGRAVQIAEAETPPMSASKWQDVLAKCASVERAIGSSGCDEGWAATATLLASTYVYPKISTHRCRQQHQVEVVKEDMSATALELVRIASDGARDNTSDSTAAAAAAAPRHPWLKAEACLHLAGLALWAGDVARADGLLKTAAEAAKAAVAAVLPKRAVVSPKSGGVAGSSPSPVASWVGTLSGPGREWRELSLRCLVDERIGSGNAGAAGRDAAAVAAMTAPRLGRVDAAISSFEESFRLRGAPAGEGGYAHLLGHLRLARASLLVKLGRLEEARSAVELASAGVARAARSRPCPTQSAEQTFRSDGFDGASGPARLHYRALCIASELHLAEDERELAKEKLREVLDMDARSADALSRLGWLLLGFGGGAGEGSRRVRCRRQDVEAARPLLERAVAEEPGCSFHAFQLARCYWELGGLYRQERQYCFNSLLKAAKLDASNAEAFEWLGYWYQGVGGDSERARGCFLRAVKLDPYATGAGEALALLYLETGQETLAVSLFRECAAVSVSCHWAWAGLGRTRILEGKLAEAASHIQQAIRGCPTSWSYWSDLGWCYHAEGKQAAALKAYTRAEALLAELHEYRIKQEHEQEQEQKDEKKDEDGSPTSPTSPTEEREASSVSCQVELVELAARVRLRTQVGTIQRQIGQVDESVKCFKDALALDPESRLALEGSGEAYLAQAHARTSEGLYTAAAKALRNGCEATRRFLGLVAAPAAGLTTATDSGIGDRTVAKGSAADTAIFSRECAWKLLGDLHTYAHKLPPMCFEGERSRAVQGQGDSSEGGGLLGLGTSEAAVQQASLANEGARYRLEFVAQGANAYEELVQLLTAKGKKAQDGGNGGRNGNDDGWGDEQGAVAAASSMRAMKAAALYDLGLNYLLRARLVCSDAGEGSGLFAQEVYEDLPEVADFTRSAEEAFRRSIEAEPTFSDAWNGLGAAMSMARKPLVQQHCWVRAVQLEHNPSAWANLGMLYVRWGLDVQAYESFGGLQAVTDHPTMWVGLGLLKEKGAHQHGIASAKRRRLLSQASDAYYSCLETGQHVDGLLGLGMTAGQTHSQADALVALQQHLDLSPSSAQAWNYLGAASELAGRGTQAVAAYRRALGLLEEQRERFKAAARADDVWEEAVRIAKGNLGRALVLTGESEKAVACLGATDLAQQADSMLQLGRAHALLGNWDEALAALEEGPLGVNGLVSGAAVRYFRGDERGAAAAAASLMARHPQDRRVLHAVVSLAALVGDSSLVQQASRALQTLPKRGTASDSDGRLSRQHAAEEELWAIHLAMRVTGAPDSACRRALSKAVHLSPSSISSWARLGAATADSAAAAAAVAPAQHQLFAEGRDPVSSNLAEVCLSAAERLAMSALLGKARDAGVSSASGAREESAAKELATTLSGIAKALMCGGGGRGGSDRRVGASSKAVRTMSRAVHLYPGERVAWRCLANALVGDALSGACKVRVGPGKRDEMMMMLGDAHALYRSISDSERVLRRPFSEGDQGGCLTNAEADYTGLLFFGRKMETISDVSGDSDESFAASLTAARVAVSGGVDGDSDSGGRREDAIKRYKLALRARPRALVGWRELAACYELWGQHHASAAALKCGTHVAGAGAAVDGDGDGGGGRQCKMRRSARAAPLYLQMAAKTLLMSPVVDDVGLASVGEAFRLGRGGAAGHALRGLIYSRLGKDSLAAGAFTKAADDGLDPAVAALVDSLALTWATAEVAQVPPVVT